MIVITAAFTKSAGLPAEGLVLAEIDLYLTRYNRSTGAVEVIWDGTQNPTVEIDNIGMYLRVYSGENLALYTYFARASYTGATVLDTDHVTGGVGPEPLPVGPTEYIYTVTNSSTDTAIQGVLVDVTQAPSGAEYVGAWATATLYDATDVVTHNSVRYICILGHTSGASTEPGVGVDWETNWSTITKSGVIWTGYTNEDGQAEDIYGRKPWLDSGSYYFWKYHTMFTDDSSPDVEVV